MRRDNAVNSSDNLLWLPSLQGSTWPCLPEDRNSACSQKVRLRNSPADARRWINVGLTLVHRLRRWTNVKPTLIQHLVSAGSGRSLIYALFGRGNFLKSKQSLLLTFANCTSQLDNWCFGPMPMIHHHPLAGDQPCTWFSQHTFWLKLHKTASADLKQRNISDAETCVIHWQVSSRQHCQLSMRKISQAVMNHSKR